MILLEAPFDIISQDTGVDTYTGGAGTGLDLAEIGILIRKFIIYGGIVTVLAGLIAIIFIRSNEKMYSEEKSRIMTRILIIWLSISAVTIFNIVKGVLEGLF